jgi:hypothetical protein
MGQLRRGQVTRTACRWLMILVSATKSEMLTICSVEEANSFFLCFSVLGIVVFVCLFAYVMRIHTFFCFWLWCNVLFFLVYVF